MGAGVVREGDNCSGHSPCWEPRPAAEYSSNVFVNSKAVVRNGDALNPHGTPPVCIPPHSATYSGSNTVFANGKSMQKQGDSISCSSTCDECSSNVFIG